MFRFLDIKLSNMNKVDETFSKMLNIVTTEGYGCLTLGCILSLPVMNWACPPPSLASPLMSAELEPSPMPKEKHLQCTNKHEETHCSYPVLVIYLWFYLWEAEFFFTRLITSLVLHTSPSVKTKTSIGEGITACE